MADDELRRWDFAAEEIITWAQHPRLERSTDTALHKLIADWRNGALLQPPDVGPEKAQQHNSGLLDFPFQILVVEHGWAAAFQGAEDFGEIGDQFDFQLPYPHCCFEFVISGKKVCFVTHFNGENYRLAAFVKTKWGWVQPPLMDARFKQLSNLLNAQMRAIGIALDAEVCTTDVIRAPHKLNKAREKRGELPIYDYHIVKLTNRNRVAALPLASNTTEAKRSTRLHFRRGHWRHFETHKTWIKWTLVGNQDLGFIDKHYKL